MQVHYCVDITELCLQVSLVFTFGVDSFLLFLSISCYAGDIKPCPRCGAFIVKMDDGSCNHMTCAICGAEFCWLCMKEISDLHYLRSAEKMKNVEIFSFEYDVADLPASGKRNFFAYLYERKCRWDEYSMPTVLSEVFSVYCLLTE